MPKERKDGSSLQKCRASPFRCSSRSIKQPWARIVPETEENIREFDEVRCPVCMEHPHNAVLLLCSSHCKGCRPFMCDTSYRHSNCLDQFKKGFEASFSSSSELITYVENLSDALPVTSSSLQTSPDDHSTEVRAADSTCDWQEMQKLSCPLCRGQINGWLVVESARRFMNAKTRSCAHESCTFSGPYADLRKHARQEHPLARPAEVDPDRQRDWRRLEWQRDLGDVLSTIQSAMPGALSFGDSLELDGGEDISHPHEVEFPSNEGSFLTVLLLFRVFRPGSPLNRQWVLQSRFGGAVGRRRTSSSVPTTVRRSLWGEDYEEVPAIVSGTIDVGIDDGSEDASGSPTVEEDGQNGHYEALYEP